MIMRTDPLDEVVVSIPLGDPPGEVISLSARVLCQNILATGMVGSGKTTSVIYPILKNLISFRASEPDRKIGLFVFDSKCDRTSERVQAWAEQSGRGGDIVVIRPGSKWGFCPIPDEGLLSRIEIVAAKITAGFNDMGTDNEYWNQTMRCGVEAALAMDMLEHGNLEYKRSLGSLSNTLLNCTSDGNARSRVAAFEDKFQAARPHLDGNCARIIEGYCRVLKNWINLDPKTRSILQSCVNNALRPILSPRMLDYLPLEGRIAFDVEKIVTEGKILVLRTNASADQDLASTLGRLIKADLYQALQNRCIKAEDNDRFVGLIFDEYPLVATANEPFFGDVQNLQTLREKRGFVVAATQGYVSMNNAIGRRAWEGLRINFGTCVFMKSNEPEVEIHARNIIGRKESETSVRMKVMGTDCSSGGVTTASESKRQVSIEGESHIIAAGALARLESHEGYYITSDGEISESPVFLLPVFEAGKPLEMVATTNLLDISAAVFRHSAASLGPPSPTNIIESAIFPAICPVDSSGTPTPLPLGSGNLLDVVHLSQVLDNTASCSGKKANPSIKQKAIGLHSRTFSELLLLVGNMERLDRFVAGTFLRAEDAVRAFSKAFKEKSVERKISGRTMAGEARTLFDALGISPMGERSKVPPDIENRDSKVLCSLRTRLDLGGLPEECFNRHTVNFFSVLKEPFYEKVMPGLALVTVLDGFPLAVFEPAQVARENAVLVAAAMVCFANCFRPKCNNPSPAR